MNRKLITVGLILLSFKVCLADEYLFSAPPTESREASIALYSPIEQFMSEASGHSFKFVYSDNWPNYISNMQKSTFDLLLDAPHLVSWRIENLGHRPLISLSSELTYVIVVMETGNFQSVFDLKGKNVCASSIPNLDALTLLDQYYSSWTQPGIVVSRSFSQAIQWLKADQCQAAVLPEKVYENFTEGEIAGTDVIFVSQTLPHYGLSVSSNVDIELQNLLQTALLAPDGIAALEPIRGYYGLLQSDLPGIADFDAYSGYGYLLSEYWGF